LTPFDSLPTGEKFHLDLMPSTCLLHRSMLYFISGFMNYKARKLLSETSIGHFRKPSGDVVIANFPKLLDCPDIWTPFSKIWVEEIVPKISGSNTRSITFVLQHMEEFVTRMYPVLYSDEFRRLEHLGATSTAIADSDTMQKRNKLVHSALRYNKDNYSGVIEKQPPSDFTEFTPFNIKEFEYEVWDTSKSR
jgi:hypothetical protein